MAAQLPTTAAVLPGPHLRLGPFTETDAPELAQILLAPEVYAHGYVMHPPPSTYDEALSRAMGSAHATPPNGLGHGRTVYAIRLGVDLGDVPAGTLVGTSSLGDFDPGRESAHLGWTLYDPRVWSTVVNPETKLLLLTHAFETLDAGVVGWRTDHENHASRRAIERLGARRDGVLRHHAQRRDGTVRDTVMYSLLADEWPPVRERLTNRLEG